MDLEWLSRWVRRVACVEEWSEESGQESILD